MNPFGDPYQVLSDCPKCRTEASIVQLMDPMHPASHLGVPVDSRCRMCSWAFVAAEEPFVPRLPMTSGRCPACQKPLPEAARFGEAPCPHCDYEPLRMEVHGPLDLGDQAAARAALVRWAEEEGVPVDDFCAANMGRPADEVVQLLVQRRPVPTSFDVIAYLFPSGAAGGAASMARTPEVVDLPPVEVVEPDPVVVGGGEAPMHPRTPARVLVSVMLADGELRAGERQFVNRFLQLHDLEPLSHNDLRVWRPLELGPQPPPELRDRILEAAVHLAHLDRERDGSEWKVLSAFARAWGVTDDQLGVWDKQYDRRYATTMNRLWRSLTRLVRVH